MRTQIDRIVAASVALSCSVWAQSTLRVPSQYPTITAAVLAAVDGDTVLVDDGIYHEAGIDFFVKTIELRSVGGPDVTIIDGTGQPSIGVQVFGGQLPGARIEGFTFRNGGTSVLVGGGSPTTHLEVVDCVFVDNLQLGYAGISADGNFDLVVRRCSFVRNVGALIGAGVGVRGTDPGHRSTARIEACRFVDNEILQSLGGGAGVAIVANVDVAVRDCEFVGGVVPSSTAGSAISIGTSPNQVPPSVEVVGCTFAGNDAPVISIVDGPSLVLRDSVLWGNASGPGPQIFASAAASPTLLDVAWCDLELPLPAPQPNLTVIASNNVSVDPAFGDPSSGDYRLLPTSPLVDAGDPARAVVGVDAWGDTRAIDGDGDGTRRIDIGADEVSRFEIGVSTVAPQPGASWTTTAAVPRPGDQLAAAVLFVSLAESDLFFPSFGQLLLDPASLVEIPMPAGSVALSHPGVGVGTRLVLQAVGVVQDPGRSFFQLSNRVHMTLR
jgi:serine protease